MKGRHHQQDLFGGEGVNAGPDKSMARSVPLAARMRPRSLDEFVGQDHLLGPGQALRLAIQSGQPGSLILWGPPGCGKSSLALLIPTEMGARTFSISAVGAGVPELRRIVEQARQLRARQNCSSVLLVDEVHRWSKMQQDVLLPYVEDGTLTLIAVTTENPYFDVVAPLRSRLRIFRMDPLGPAEVRKIVLRALTDGERGLGLPAEAIDEEALDLLVASSGGDARVALNGLEAAYGLSTSAGGDGPRITAHAVAQALQGRQVRYDRSGDDHYQTISAFIKSVRGSDPDAAIFWLAKMLEAGEDVRFIARRLIILASEDVGNADPQGLMVASAAAQAVEYVGLPEAELVLAQATIYLATAPKSNASAAALWRAREAIRQGANLEVPLHLRNLAFAGARDLGYGVEYRYPHDWPGHHVRQQYLPDGVDQVFYRPSDQGLEQEIARRLATWRGGGQAQADSGTESPAPQVKAEESA